MILDTLSNYKIYSKLSERLAMAFEYIVQTDFIELESGKYIVEPDTIFALVQEYDTKEEGKLESHYAYIDIQYMIKGSERIGFALLNNQEIISKNIEKDIVFYKGEASYLQLDAGMFAVFFPQDLHMPCIKLHKTAKVKKVVVKVKIE